jgi:hypothetical protein
MFKSARCLCQRKVFEDWLGKELYQKNPEKLLVQKVGRVKKQVEK